MSSELELRWLKTGELKGAAKRFAEFCKQDVKTEVDQVDFDMAVYQDAIKLVLSRLDHSLTVEKLTQRISAEQAVETGEFSDQDGVADSGEAQLGADRASTSSDSQESIAGESV